MSSHNSNSATIQNHIMLSQSMIPHSEAIVFHDSSFFKSSLSRKLPTPAEVREAVDLRRRSTEGRTRLKFPVAFPSLNLMVKFGPSSIIPEGQCLWTIRKYLGDTVPVPEVYGWCKDNGEYFLYMELVRGATLEQRWGTLSASDKLAICDQLHLIVNNLRRIEQDPSDRFIGHIGRQPLHDRVNIVSGNPDAGPFPDVKSFHDWFSNLAWRNKPGPFSPHPMRPGLPDNVSINFTHSDLHPSNILITPAREGQARGKWETMYLPRILKQHDDAYYHWDYFCLTLGV